VESFLVAIATAIALYSSSWAVPVTILSGSLVGSESFTAKSVNLV
jgi:hypothetical protein